MPIIIQGLNDLLCPQVVCDACDRIITNAHMAVAASRMDGERNMVVYAHKGPCHEAVEIVLGKPGSTGWAELTEHLCQLQHNAMVSEPIRQVTAKESVNDRVCFVCGRSVPERAGVYHSSYGILAHDGRCSKRVRDESRTYEHSSRGRRRPCTEVLRRLEETRGS